MTVADLFALLPYVAFACIGLLFSVIDIRTHQVPDRLLLIASGILMATLVGATITHGEWARLLTAALAATTLFVFYLLLGILNPQGIGGGDAKFAAPVGAMLGFLGWGTVIIGTLAALVLVAFAALLALGYARIRGGEDPPLELPFVPFICLGAWIAILWGDPIRLAVGFV